MSNSAAQGLSSSAQSFRLLDLPLELRQHVYSYMVGYIDYTSNAAVRNFTWLNPNFLLTNHQVYHEARPIIYAQPLSIYASLLMKTDAGCCLRDAIRGCPLQHWEIEVDLTRSPGFRPAKKIDLYTLLNRFNAQLIDELDSMSSLEKVDVSIHKDTKDHPDHDNDFHNFFLNMTDQMRYLSHRFPISVQANIPTERAESLIKGVNLELIRSFLVSDHMMIGTKRFQRLYAIDKSAGRARLDLERVDLHWEQESYGTRSFTKDLTVETKRALREYAGCEGVSSLLP